MHTIFKGGRHEGRARTCEQSIIYPYLGPIENRAIRTIFCVYSLRERRKGTMSAFMLALSLPNVETNKLLPRFMDLIRAQVIGGVLWEYTPTDNANEIKEFVKQVSCSS